MKNYHVIILLTAIALLLVGCGSEPQTVEVTRIVNQEIPVTVEVTRQVAVAVTVPVEIPVEVPVEVTRLVEVVASPTPEAASSETAVPAAEDQPTATAAAQESNQTAVSSVYTVQSGDNMSLIAAKTGVSAGDIMAANNLTNASILIVGQQLNIPGWDGQLVNNPAPNPPAANASPAPSEPPVAAVPVGPNLLPNASFEGDWYFFNGVPEWQISEGWSLAIDEGPNPLTDEDDLFVRPEVRVVSKANLPPAEHDLFVFDGLKTIKIFKGGAPVHFAVFTNLQLPAGAYRFTINFFSDAVAGYDNGVKIWATHPQAAEVRFILNSGGGDWLLANPGQKNTLSFDFTLEELTAVRLGADFRNRFINDNNGWFLDDWSLQQLGTP